MIIAGICCTHALAADAPNPAPGIAPDIEVPLPPDDTKPATAPEASEADELPVIVIQGRRRRLVAPPQNPTRFVTRIELADSTSSLDSISAELEKTVGVTVRRLGGLGAYSTLSIRGSSAQQVEIFWDGIPLNRADSGLTNLEDIPMDLVERIELYRGAAPAQFGAAGIGGVVNLITRRPPSRGTAGTATPPRAFGLVSLSAGSWDTAKFDAMIGGPLDDMDGLFFYHRLQSRGNFDYENDNGTPLNPNDDRTERRVNNDFIAQDFFGRLTGPLPHDWQWSALLDVFDKEQGLAGLASVQARHARLHTSRGIAALRFTGPATATHADPAAPPLAMGANLLYEEVTYQDPQAELSFSSAHDLTVTSSVAATIQAGQELRPRELFFSMYGEARHEETFTIYHEPVIRHSPVQGRDALAGVLQSEARAWQSRLRLIPTLRGELFFNHLAGDPRIGTPALRGENHATLALLNPSLGILFAPWPDLEFKANAGRFHRVPTLVELFGNRGGLVGEPNLAPEQADSFDIGFQVLPPLPTWLGRWEVEYAFFYVQTEHLIAWVRNSQNTSKPTNLGSARNLGHELTLHADTFEPWAGALWPSLQFNYTHQDPRDESNSPFLNGNYLPNQPVDSWFLRGELAWQADAPAPGAATSVAITRSISVWAEYSYDGESFRDRANLFSVEARAIVNAGLKWREPTAAGECSFALDLKNLTDNRVTDVAQFPLPGRSVFGTVQWKY